MEVKSTDSKAFTDFEAFQFLKQIKSGHQRNTPTPLATITYEALRYLDTRPGSKVTQQQILDAQKRYKELNLNLTPNVIAQLINDPPQGTLDVQVLLGDSIHDRSDDDIAAILQVSKDIFGDLEEQ